jgi:hypothetical protein
VIIAAGGAGLDDPATPENEAGKAISKLTVQGSATNLNVLGGYSGAGTATAPLGTASNPDARIGSVTFNGAVLGVNVVSGVTAGTDGRFGTADDAAIAGGSATVISRIAKVVLKGAVGANTEIFGISAQIIANAILGETPIALNTGSSNDDLEIAPAGSKLRLHEVAVV